MITQWSCLMFLPPWNQMAIIKSPINLPTGSKSKSEVPPRFISFHLLVEKNGLHLIGGSFGLPFRCLLAIFIVGDV